MLGLKSAIAYLGGCMSLKFRTEIWAGDINLGVIYIRMNLNHETRWDLQGIIKQKEEVHGLSLGAPSVWRSGEEAIKETEAVGHEVRQIKRAWSPWAPVKQVLKKGHVINHAKWLSHVRTEQWPLDLATWRSLGTLTKAMLEGQVEERGVSMEFFKCKTTSNSFL